ncbi:MAG: Atg14 domain-containing protein [Pseudomonadales bacterium]|nr:Atg14 domain-containing protein [Pseudomonadales bacterium]
MINKLQKKMRVLDVVGKQHEVTRNALLIERDQLNEHKVELLLNIERDFKSLQRVQDQVRKAIELGSPLQSDVLLSCQAFIARTNESIELTKAEAKKLADQIDQVNDRIKQLTLRIEKADAVRGNTSQALQKFVEENEMKSIEDLYLARGLQG